MSGVFFFRQYSANNAILNLHIKIGGMILMSNLNNIKRMGTIQGGRGQWDVNYTSPQSFIISFS